MVGSAYRLCELNVQLYWIHNKKQDMLQIPTDYQLKDEVCIYIGIMFWKTELCIQASVILQHCNKVSQLFYYISVINLT